MKKLIKKALCLLFSVAFLLSTCTVFATAKENRGDRFFGYIEALGVESEGLGWYLAARDKDDVVYIEADEFARLAKGKIIYNDERDKFKYLIGNWNIKIEVETKKVSAALSFEFGLETENAFFEKTYFLTDIIDANGSYYLPLEEMMYICCLEWQCSNNVVLVHRPYTLFDIICDTRDMLGSTVTPTDLLGEGIDYYGNSFKYGIAASLDEINMTFIADSVITTFSEEASMTYEIDNLSNALLLLMSDVPEKSSDSPAIKDTVFKLANTAATVMDIQTADDAARIPVINDIVYKFAKVPKFDDVTAQKLSKVSGAAGLSATALSYFVSVAKTLETAQNMPENFADRLKYLQSFANGRRDMDPFYIDLEKAAKQTYDLHYTSVAEAFKKNVNFDAVTGIISSIANFSGGIEKVAWPLCYASLAVSTMNLVIDGLKLIPAVAKVFDDGENAFICRNLLNTGSTLKSEYLKNALVFSNYDYTTEKWLNDFRLSAQCMMSALLHAHEKLVALGKVSAPSGGYKEAMYLNLLTATENYDYLLDFSTAFTNMHSGSPYCTRDEIPPEYVFYRLPLLKDYSSASYTQGKDVIEVKTTVECPHPLNVPEITIKAENDIYGSDSTFKIIHEFCDEPYTMTIAGVCFGDFYGFDMGDGEYTYIINLYCVGTRGGSYSYAFKVIDGVFTKILTFDGEKRDDEVWVEASFISEGTLKGVIHPTNTAFEAEVWNPNKQRTGTSVWENGTGYMGYEEREDGFYDIIFKTYERNLFNADSIGGSYTRYVLDDGKLVLNEQWYKTY